MTVTHRVFGRSEQEPSPEDVLAELRRLGVEAPWRCHRDDQGWLRLVLLGPSGKSVMEVERFLAAEEGIRAELNTWAAWLETTPPGPHQGPLMERLILSRQVFLLQPPEGDESPDPAWEGLCRFLARRTDGVYQIDGRGFFAADGTPLAAEAPE